jgi:hypothetical protein
MALPELGVEYQLWPDLEPTVMGADVALASACHRPRLGGRGKKPKDPLWLKSPFAEAEAAEPEPQPRLGAG